MFVAAVLTVFLASAPATPGRGETVVEKVVAVVCNPPGSPRRVITLTRLIEEARVAFIERGGLLASTRTIDGPALRATLDWLVGEMLIADEAARLKVDEVDPEAVDAEVRRFREKFPTQQEYRRFVETTGVSEDELAATLARGLRVKKYLASRVGRSAQLTDAEVERAAQARGLGSLTPALRDALRSRLVEERARAQGVELVEELKARADVRVLDSFEDAETSGHGR